MTRETKGAKSTVQRLQMWNLKFLSRLGEWNETRGQKKKEGKE